MAPYFRDPNLDENQDQTNVAISSAGQQAGADGAAAAPSGSSSGTGSRFTNIDTYLKNNPESFGQEFGGKVGSTIGEAKSNFDQTAQQAQNRIQSTGTVPTQQEIQGLVANAGDKTTDEDAKKFQGWMNQKYTGPTGVDDTNDAWGQYWGKAEHAKQTVKQAGTEPGRFALLDQFYGRPTYSHGQQALDNLIVQAGGGFNNVGELQKQANELQGYGTQKANEVRNAAAQRSGQIEQAKQSARRAIGLGDNGQIQGGALGDIQSQVDARVKAENDARESQYQNMLKTNSNIENEIFGIDPTRFVQRGTTAKRENVATDADYAKYLALSKLAGVEPTYLSAANRSMAGKDIGDPTIDQVSYQNEARDKKNAWVDSEMQKFYGPDFAQSNPRYMAASGDDRLDILRDSLESNIQDLTRNLQNGYSPQSAGRINERIAAMNETLSTLNRLRPRADRNSVGSGRSFGGVM